MSKQTPPEGADDVGDPSGTGTDHHGDSRYTKSGG